MKKKTKRILGSCGLLTVVAMTAVAAFLPTPGTPAASAVNQVVDTVTVRVVSGNPEVSLSNFKSGGDILTYGAETTNADISFDIDYSAVLEPYIVVEYTSLQNAKRTETIFKQDVGYATGVETLHYNLFDLEPVSGAVSVIDERDSGLSLASVYANTMKSSEAVAKVDISETGSARAVEYAMEKSAKEAVMRLTTSESGEKVPFGYGWYKFTIHGRGIDNDPANESSFYFKFIPLTASYTEEDDDFILHLNYEYDNPTLYDKAHGVSTINVKVYEIDGETRTLKHDNNYSDGTKTIKLPIDSDGKKYQIEITAYERNSDIPIAQSTILTVQTAAKVVPGTGVDINTPDTGVFGGKLNISKTDYLITGLVVFGIVVIAGFVFVLKGGKQKTKRK